MKSQTFSHSKLNRLQRALGVPKYAAVGLLGCLWNLTKNEAPAGDIGKLADEDIAAACGWEGEASLLIAGLVEARWLDVDPQHRLLVHDWADHCEDQVNMKLARAIRKFADGRMPNLARLSKLERKGIEEQYAAQSSAPERTNAREGALPYHAVPYHAVPYHAVPYHAVPGPDENHSVVFSRVQDCAPSNGPNEREQPDPPKDLGPELVQPLPGMPVIIQPEWDEFRKAWGENCEVEPSPADWAEAAGIFRGMTPMRDRRLMNASTRQAAAQYLREMEPDDPARRSLPVNYLARAMFERRRIRTAVATGPVPKKSKLEAMLEEVS